MDTANRVRKDGITGAIIAMSGMVGWCCSQIEQVRTFYHGQIFEGLDSQTDSEVLRYGECEAIEFTKQTGSLEGIQSISDPEQAFPISQPYVYTVNNAIICGPVGVSITPGGEYIFENSIERIKPLTKGAVQSIAIKRFERAMTIDSPVVSFVGPFTDNYFHWFSDYLPRLAGVEEYERACGEKPLILLPKNPAQWLIDSLELLDFNQDDFLYWNERLWNINTLVVPSVPRSSSVAYDPAPVFSKNAREWVRNKFTGKVQSDSCGPQRVFISRKDASIRRIKNRCQVMKVLNEYGFEVINLTNMSLKEQISLFQGVDTIVAPHGAGLTNMLWGSNQQIIEIFGADVSQGVDRKACYYRMANQLGHEYVSIHGKNRLGDIILPPDHLENVLSEILKQE